jgi:hypothetical protein
MKVLTIAAAILALMAMPAYAQMGSGRRHSGDENKKAEPAKKVDEKAYKAALERIPEPKEKYDPWGVTKSAEPGNKSKTPLGLLTFKFSLLNYATAPSSPCCCSRPPAFGQEYRGGDVGGIDFDRLCKCPIANSIRATTEAD